MDPTDFTNSPFTSPQQVELMRRYAAQLLQPLEPGQIAPHWTGALAAGLRGALGPMVANRATQLQQIGLQGAAQQDPNLTMLQARGLLGQNAPTSVPGASAQPMSFAGTSDPVKQAILMQESGNRSNISPSVSGAVGPGQIMPATFSQFAKPGENINDPNANRDVSGRILDKYMSDYGDPARAAVAYFSGPGNVAPPGSPTPWKRDVADPNGKTVSSYVRDIMGRMGGTQVAQAGPMGNYSAYQHNPWANPAEQALARGMVTPAPYEDVYKRPGMASVMGGARALPVGPGLQPGVMGGVSAGPGGVTAQVPITPPGSQGGAPQYGGANLGAGLAPIVGAAQDITRSNLMNVAGAEPQAAAVKQDQTFSAQAPLLKQTLGTIRDDIKTHGNEISWGPQTETITQLKRFAVNYAPGIFTQEQIAGIAGADSLQKMTGILGSLLARQIGNAGGTDFSQQLGQAQVPGMHNSKEGAIALADMIEQGVDQTRKLGEEFRKLPPTARNDPNFDYIGFRQNFFNRNPIINPLTHNPITQDLLKMTQGGGTEPTTYKGGWGRVIRQQ